MCIFCQKGKYVQEGEKLRPRAPREEKTQVNNKSLEAQKPTNGKTDRKVKEDMDINETKKDKKGKGSGTKDACYHKVKSLFCLVLSAY